MSIESKVHICDLVVEEIGKKYKIAVDSEIIERLHAKMELLESVREIRNLRVHDVQWTSALHRPKRSVDHPVFIAQHATATCCWECIRKWHKMQPGRELSQMQQDYLVDVIMTWIQKKLESE